MARITIQDKLTLPNVLSFYRLITFPVVLYFILTKKENVFVVLLVVDLITDVLDGYIARRFKLQTDFGAKLDALADIGMYILVFLGIFAFKVEDFKPVMPSLVTFLIVFIIPKIISVIKFGTFPSLHLYASKFGGYLQGFFFFHLFVFGFNTIFYYIMIVLGIASFVEQIIVILLIPEMRPDTKGLYWILKKR